MSIEREKQIDGADQIASDGRLVKGGGAALTCEKIIGAADRFVVIADSSKPVAALHGTIPVEAAVLRAARHDTPDRASCAA
jgi:ribose 5-phosphate isomerase